MTNTNWKEWFEKWGDSFPQAKKDFYVWPTPFDMEDLYQAFAARMREELNEEFCKLLLLTVRPDSAKDGVTLSNWAAEEDKS